MTANSINSDFSIQVGEQKSRAIELDIAGEILPGWNIIDFQITRIREPIAAEVLINQMQGLLQAKSAPVG